ncbi:Urease accessory protein D [Citrus sinensis]|nr:Urease accessory protein D [Citrus sinensis]
MNPQVGSSETDAVWVYTLTYGGGIVSGDSISCEITVADACTAVLTTQASTKVYKSLGSKSSEQILEVTVFCVPKDFIIILNSVMTLLSNASFFNNGGRRRLEELEATGVKIENEDKAFRFLWSLPTSYNYLLPTLIYGKATVDLEEVISILLSEEKSLSGEIIETTDVSALAKIGSDALLAVIPDPVTCFSTARPKLKQIQIQVQENVRRMMSEQLYLPSTGLRPHGKTQSDHFLAKPSFVVSCSAFGPKGIGIVVRIAAMTTESVYRFLQHQLTGMETLLGVSPYS